MEKAKGGQVNEGMKSNVKMAATRCEGYLQMEQICCKMVTPGFTDVDQATSGTPNAVDKVGQRCT